MTDPVKTPLEVLISNLGEAMDSLAEWRSYHVGANGGLPDETCERLRAMGERLQRLHTHGGVSFELEQEHRKWTQFIDSGWDRVCGLAISVGASNGMPVIISLMCSSEEGAESIGFGDVHRDDPEASVTERLIIRVESQGRIP